jgi:large subunit ribosomal protein L3
MMAGQEGGFSTTNRNLEVIKVDAEKNYMLIKGNVPGPKRGLVVVKTTTKRIKSVPARNLVDLTVAKED